MTNATRAASEREAAMRHLQAASLSFYRAFLLRPTEGSLTVLRGLSELLREVTREAVASRRGWRIPIVQVDAEGDLLRRSY